MTATLTLEKLLAEYEHDRCECEGQHRACQMRGLLHGFLRFSPTITSLRRSCSKIGKKRQSHVAGFCAPAFRTLEDLERSLRASCSTSGSQGALIPRGATVLLAQPAYDSFKPAPLSANTFSPRGVIMNRSPSFST